MTDRIVAEGDIIPVSDNGLIALIHGERNEIVSLVMQSSSRCIRNGGHHAIEISSGNGNFARDGIADAIRRLRNRGLANHLDRRTCNGGCSLRHELYSIAPCSFGPRYNRDMPAVRQPRWYVIPLRVLLLSFLLTLLAFAVSLLLAILGMLITARLRGFQPDMTLAYRNIALPIALAAGVVTLIVTTVLEIRNYRQARALAQIARASR
jgi:hypothetical protein